MPFPGIPYSSFELDVARFDGSDPLGWICKISQFFNYDQTPKDRRINSASFYMGGPTLSLF